MTTGGRPGSVPWFVLPAVACLLVGGTGRPLPAQSNGSEAEYRALLAANPNDSRALYRLAELRRDHPRESVTLLERYTILEPSDAWGFIALGDALGRARRVKGAMRAYDAAERLAPGERDVTVGRARVLARSGRTDESIAILERWCVAHSGDADVLRELATLYRRAGRLRASIAALERAQRARFDAGTARRLDALRSATAPHLDPSVSISHDSDGNGMTTIGGMLGFLGDGVDIAVGGATRQVGDAAESVRLGEVRAALAWRPRSTVRVLAEAGAVTAPGVPHRVGTPGPPGLVGPPQPADMEAAILPTGRLRYVWREAEGRARLDLRAGRTALDASPLLIRNRVTRIELGGEGELRVVRPIALRATARLAAIASAVDDNRRTALGGRLVATVPIAGEVTVGGQRMTYAHATDAGYFAPRWTEMVELGIYREIERASGVTLALDLGAGVQRMAAWDAAPIAWAPAVRGWAALGIPLGGGREIRVEAEGYDAAIGSEVASAAPRWRYGSLSVWLRWPLR